MSRVTINVDLLYMLQFESQFIGGSLGMGSVLGYNWPNHIITIPTSPQFLTLLTLPISVYSLDSSASYFPWSLYLVADFLKIY